MVSCTKNFIVPGQELNNPNESQPGATYQFGQGTFERNGKFYASIFGQPLKESGIISVESCSRSAKVPTVGTTVAGVITKVNKLQAHVSIIMIEDIPLPLGQEFQGAIRSQDVMQVDKDKVVVWDCFRPGDVVRAEVISLPTSSMGYLLATHRNHLGVLFAHHSLTGNRMTAVSWKEMMDNDTLQKELRKVAGPIIS